MSITVFAPPKVNLRLLVGPVRADGYHPLRSLMVALDGPADRVTVTRAAERAVRCPGIDGPANLAWAALDALEADPIASGWLPPLLLETFLGVKRWELETAADDDDLEATCARYASAY